MSDDIPICEPGGSGLVLPFNDYSWPKSLRGVLYAVAMVYTFLGVAIVADMFMAAIEAVTKRRKRKTLKTGTVVTVYVWNDTVANLSLMALGSSAPEIFLSLIDLLRTGFRASDLGSATIVGSAAFNLLCIVAVCIISISSDDQRAIEQYSVFIVTGIFSLVAYLWLAFILVVWTPNIVDIWEALVTLFMFPALLYVSYKADVGVIQCGAHYFVGHEVAAEELRPRASPRPSASDSEALDSDQGRDWGRSQSHEQRTNPSDGIDDIGQEGEVTLDVRSVNIKPAAWPQHQKLAENNSIGSKSAEGSTNSRPLHKRLDEVQHPRMKTDQKHTLRSSSNMSFASSSKSQGSRQKLAKKQLTRQFSLASHKSDIADETSAKAYMRRKSIAAHHNQAVKWFVKKGGQGAQTGLGSSLSLSTQGTATNQEPANDEDEYRTESEVQLLIDRMFLSSQLAMKPVTIVRTGNHTVSLRVDYTVHRLKQPSERIAVTQVQCARVKLQEEDQAPESKTVVDWLSYCDVEEVLKGTVIIKEDVREMKLIIENPGLGEGVCADFIVSLTNVEATEIPEGPAIDIKLGRIRSTYVMQDLGQHPELCGGVFSFGMPSLTVRGSSKKHTCQVLVVRHSGCVGKVSIAWKTEALTAVADVDYAEASGVLNFEEGESEKLIAITTLEKGANRVAREFLVILEALEDDVNEYQPQFNSFDDGGDDSAIMAVKIGERNIGHKSFGKMFDKWFNTNHLLLGLEEWKDGFASALLCNGSWEDQKEASISDWIFHFVSLPWNLIFCLIPPTTFFGGWLCFCFCLIFIGATTGIIADLAELFGCVCDIPDIITAISFVALGTSMPDLFASKVAATEDPTADASIVNVTGSNSVNVFLGLGLPWTLAALYWNLKPWDKEWAEEYWDVAKDLDGSNCVFIVPSANLGFSIVSFCCACCGAILLLVVRRRSLGGELGGPALSKISSSVVLVTYWVGYIIVVSWRALRYGDASSKEEMGVCGGLFLLEIVITFIPLYLIKKQGRELRAERAVEEEEKDDICSPLPASSGTMDKGPLDRGLSLCSETPTIPVEPCSAPALTGQVWEPRAKMSIQV